MKENNNSLLFLLLAGGALLIGGLMIMDVFGLPVTEQVSNPEASTKVAADNQLVLFALIVLGVVGAVVVMGGGLAATIWVVSRQGVKLEDEPDNPFDFSLKTDGNSVGALIQRHSLMLAFTGGIALVLVLVVLASIIGVI